MKYCIPISILLLLVSCTPFDEDRVLKQQKKLLSIVDLLADDGNVQIVVDSDEKLTPIMSRTGIDHLYKNLGHKNMRFSGFPEASDSLIIFIKSSRSFFRPQKRIIYDFADKPRNFGSKDITGASYSIVQLDERWYYVTEGFD